MRLSGIFVILLTIGAVAQNQPAGTSQAFQGTYERLKPQQKLLIDDWYADYNKMMHEDLPPSDYNQLSLSTRTTFEAITHALMTTKLTGKSGQPMGNALELVQSIETINGKVPQARGDLQFRMYVMLKPDAWQTLKDSTEFFRDRDNTVYHHGYPVNYRQDGSAPTIQISMSKDGRHADIDVDYRSSKFPQALMNGHLSAANSDVRAGNNTQRHLQRWQGLTDWWRNLFGLDTPEPDTSEAIAASGDVPPVPLKGNGKLEDAVQDFLNSWLVQQKPELSAAYLSPRSFACLEEYGPQAGTEINVANAPYVAVKDMAATNRLVGKPASLQDVVKPSAVNDSRLALVKQQYGNIFGIYRVPDGVAPEFECDDQRAWQEFEAARVSGKAGKSNRYYAAIFRLKPPNETGQIITILWTKDGNYWKVVSWDIEPEDAKPGEVPDTRPTPAPAVAEEHMKGDAAFLGATNEFLKSWLVTKKYDVATSYFSPRSDACVDLYLQAGQQQPKTPEQYAVYLRDALTTIDKEVGDSRNLPDVVEPVDPDHPGLKLVSHSGEDAYTVVAVPDYLAETLMCPKESRQHPYQPAESPTPTYGQYYATLFAVRTPGEHAASLAFLWSKEGGQWKIISYEMIAP
jgi:hypothetical protein